MRRYLVKPFVTAAALALGATGALIAPASVASADTPTLCINGQNAGYSNGGNGSTYWGWCHAGAGQYVHYKVEIDCQAGGGGTTDWASGSGPATVYTQSETCWFGGVITGFHITNY